MAVNDLGIVKPGTTLYLPFHTFDSNDPSASVTLTGLAVTDIEIYKDGGTTQRASDAGYTLLDTDGIDFDGITGIHGISIDLSDNTTAGFYAAGSQYWVVISSVTVDAATVNFVLATFRIGYPDAILNTTIATLASQTSFTLTAGSADNDAYNGCIAVVHDVASAVQIAIGVVSDYVGSTKTVTLIADPGIFTMAAGDNVSFMSPTLVPATLGRRLTVDANSRIDVGSWLGTAVTTSPTTNKPQVDVDSIDDDAAAANNLESDYDGTGYNKSASTIGTCTANTDMRGTDNAALASVVGALADAAAAGDPTSVDTLMQYVKQLINTLEGTTGIPTFPAEAAPANNVSLVEVVRAIHADVTGLNGAAMRGTDNAALAAKLQAYIQLLARKDAAIGTDKATELNEINANEGSGAGAYDQTTDSQESIKDSVGGTPPTAVQIRQEMDANSTQLAAIVADTAEIGASGAGLTAVPWNAAWDAEVESEVNDALDTAISELVQGQPSATPTLRQAVMAPYMALRNNLDIDGSWKKVYNDAGSVIFKKALADDGTTYSETKAETGP